MYLTDYLFRQYGDFWLSARGKTILNSKHVVSIVPDPDTPHEYDEETGRRIDSYIATDVRVTQHRIKSKTVKRRSIAKSHLMTNLWEFFGEGDQPEYDDDE